MKAKKKNTGAAAAAAGPAAGASASGLGIIRLTESRQILLDFPQHQQLNRSRRLGDEDSPAWLAISTEGSGAFRDLLLGDEPCDPEFPHRAFICPRQNRWTGIRFAVLMARIGDGQLRSISFPERRPGKGNGNRARAGSGDEGVKRAIRFARGVAFREWSKGCSEGSSPSGAERGLKNPRALLDKVDCRCGKNRSRGGGTS